MVKRSVKDLKSSFGVLKKYVLLTEGWQGGGMGGWYLTKFLEGSLYPEVKAIPYSKGDLIIYFP